MPGAEPNRLSWREYLLLALLALVMVVPGLSSVPPVDRDESRYAVATTRMLETGDYVDIRFQDVPRYLQPAGIYWLQSAAVSALSSPEAKQIWAFRVPSMLSAVAAVLITGWLGAWLFGRRVGLTAAALLAACFSLGFEARIAKIDATLLMVILTAQVALMRLYLDRMSRPRATAALFWGALGVGLMLKGPIILIVVATTVLALLAWDRKVAWLKRLNAHWGVPLMLAIVLPWYVAIGLVSDGEFFARAIGKSMMGKVATGQQAHGAPPGYHTSIFTLAFWPGSLFAVLAIPFVWRNRIRPEVRFLIAWIVPTWIVYELIATKLPHYVLPTYPAIACLAAAALFAPRERAPGKVLKGLGIAYALLWLLVSFMFAALGWYVLNDLQDLFDPVTLAVGLIPAAAAVATLWFLWKDRPERAVASALVAALAVWANTYANALPRVTNMWISPRLAEAAKAVAPCPDSPLVTAPFHEPSLVFLYGREETRLVRDGVEAAEVFAASDGCAVVAVGADERPEFLARASTLGLTPRPAGTVKGRNYSDNRKLDIVLYVAR